MKSALKWTAIILGAVVGLVVLAVLAITVFIDPNAYKPRIEQLAAQNGYPLTINGDIGWQFYPSIGLQLGEIQLLSTTGQEPLVVVDKTHFSVALMPLFSRQIIVEEILVAGLNAQLTIDQQGEGNWQYLLDNQAKTAPANQSQTKPQSTPSAPADDEQSTPLQLAANSIQLRDARVSLRDLQQGSHLKLAPINLTINQVNLEERNFPLQADWQLMLTSAEGKPLKNRGKLAAQVAVASDFSRLQISDGQLSTALGDSALTSDAAIKASLSAIIKLGETLGIESQLAVAPFNAKALANQLSEEPLVTQDPKALTRVAASAVLSGTPDNLLINEIQVQLDDTRLDGRIRLQNFNQILLTLAGNELDLDRYLPPPASPSGAASEQTTPSTPAQPLDLSALREFGGRVVLELKKLKANNLVVENLALKADSRDGFANLEQLSADFYQGTLATSGSLDARTPVTQLALQGNIQQIALEPLLKALNQSDQRGFLLKGTTNGDFVVSSQGSTVDAIVQNLNANLKANTQSLQLAPINIERYVCQAVALIQGERIDTADWPAATDLQNLETEITLANQVATIKTLNAGVEQLKLLAKGKVDLRRQKLDVNLPITLTQPLTQQPGCVASNDWMIGKALSLVRCKGDLLNPLEACGLDERAIREAAKDYLEARVKAKTDARKEEIEQKLDERKQKIRDKINEELGEGTDQLLKDLFNRKKN